MKLWEGTIPFLNNNLTEDKPYLEPYLLKKNNKHAAFIICPGGGYTHLAEHEGKPIAKWLNKLGISAFVLYYRVFPYHHPIPLLDIQRAIRIVRHNAEKWNIDPDKIGVLGFSAGGHLASCAATLFDLNIMEPKDEIDTEAANPNLAVLCYPVISFTQFSHQGSIDSLLGSDKDEGTLQLLSTERQVTNRTPPTFLWHTADDAAVPVENSILFAKALSEKSIPFELHIYEHGRHGLGLASEEPDVANWTKTCEVWLRKNKFIM